jgi:glycerol-3-phosphate dehydrogenase subunit B
VGTVKQTYCVPKTMWNGVKALKEKSFCLLVDFQGLHDFSARQIVATLGDRWPDLRTARIPFPGPDHTTDFVTGEITAETMELSKNREKLVQDLQPHLKDAQAVGMPAVLGIRRTQEILSELEDRIGVPVFELPTLPISVPGLRLNDTFTRGLLAKGVRTFPQYQVSDTEQRSGDDFVIRISKNRAGQSVRAKAVILATGRFWGRGLRADRKGIHEAIFDLPLFQPADRNEWHHPDFFDARGHPINRAGVEIDDAFRPVDSSGRPVLQNLFAAGSILAHQDWMRMKCGSGLAIATAYGAVNASLRNL